MPRPNQIGRVHSPRPLPQPTCSGSRRARSPRPACDRNLDVALQYLAAWLGGNGCVPIYNLMEDAATAEICRAQVWQWVRHGAKLDDGSAITPEMAGSILDSHVRKLRAEIPEDRLLTAARLYKDMISGANFSDFLTLRAYDYLD